MVTALKKHSHVIGHLRHMKESTGPVDWTFRPEVEQKWTVWDFETLEECQLEHCFLTGVDILKALPSELVVSVLRHLDFGSLKRLLHEYPDLRRNTLVVRSGRSEAGSYFDISGVRHSFVLPRDLSVWETTDPILLVLCDITEDDYMRPIEGSGFNESYIDAITPFTHPLFDRILRMSKTRAVFVKSTISPGDKQPRIYMEKKKDLIFSGIPFIERVEYSPDDPIQSWICRWNFRGLPWGYGFEGIKSITVEFPRMETVRSPRAKFCNITMDGLVELKIHYHSVVPEIYGLEVAIPDHDRVARNFSLIDLDSEAWNVPEDPLCTQRFVRHTNRQLLLSEPFQTAMGQIGAYFTYVQVTGGPAIELLTLLSNRFTDMVNVTETQPPLRGCAFVGRMSPDYVYSHSRLPNPCPLDGMGKSLFYVLATGLEKDAFTGPDELWLMNSIECLVIHCKSDQYRPRISADALEDRWRLKVLSLHGVSLGFLGMEHLLHEKLEHVSLGLRRDEATLNDCGDGLVIRAFTQSTALKSLNIVTEENEDDWKTLDIESVAEGLKLRIRGFDDGLRVGGKSLRRRPKEGLAEYYSSQGAFTNFPH